MRERVTFGPPDDPIMGRADSAVDRTQKRKLTDFVIETKQTRPNQEDRFLDSVRLQQAIEDGTLSEEEIIKTLQTTFSKTLTETIVEIEGLAGKDPEAFGRELKKVRAMQAAREHYIPMADNCPLVLPTEDREKTIRDIIDWAGSHQSIIYNGAYDGKEISAEELFERLSNDDAKRMSRAAHIETNLDYASLSHGIRIDTMYTDKFRKVNIMFYGHGQPLANKIHCDADVLSALKVLNYFKKKGYEAELDLTMNSAKEGDLEIMYLAK